MILKAIFTGLVLVHDRWYGYWLGNAMCMELYILSLVRNIEIQASMHYENYFFWIIYEMVLVFISWKFLIFFRWTKWQNWVVKTGINHSTKRKLKVAILGIIDRTGKKFEYKNFSWTRYNFLAWKFNIQNKMSANGN